MSPGRIIIKDDDKDEVAVQFDHCSVNSFKAIPMIDLNTVAAQYEI